MTDIANKLVASTRTFTAFAERRRLEPELDLIEPSEWLGPDPLGTFLAAAAACRDAWRRPGALEGVAPSTVGEFPAAAVLNGRIFDTTILTWDLATACDLAHGIDDRQAAYVLYVAKALVPTVRSESPERYKDAVAIGPEASLVDQMVAATGRDPGWTPAP